MPSTSSTYSFNFFDCFRVGSSHRLLVFVGVCLFVWQVFEKDFVSSSFLPSFLPFSFSTCSLVGSCKGKERGRTQLHGASELEGSLCHLNQIDLNRVQSMRIVCGILLVLALVFTDSIMAQASTARRRQHPLFSFQSLPLIAALEQGLSFNLFAIVLWPGGWIFFN